MIKFPSNWIIVTIKNLFDVTYGKDFRKKNLSNEGVYPVYGANGIIGYHDKYTHEDPELIIGCRGSVGNTYITDGSSYITHNSLVLKSANLIPKKYLKHAIDSIDKAKVITGSSQPQITIQNLNNLQIPLAPLNEQQRIVEKLENLLQKVDACKERLDKIPAILKRFRQSVLAAACSGRLTEYWRNENGGNFDEWVAVLLKDVASSRLGKMLDKVKNIGEPTRYLRNRNVRWSSIELTDLAFIKVTPEEKNQLSISDGDVLVCEGGEPGRCAVWNSWENDIVFQKAIHRVRPHKNLLPHWLAFNIKNDADSGSLQYYFTGTTIKHLTGKSFAQYRFKLPQLSEQHEIVRRVEALFKIADQIEERYTKARAYIDKLTQSIIAKAFRGELVPQDPTDEPASELLKRIKEEKANTETKAKSRKHGRTVNKIDIKETKKIGSI